MTWVENVELVESLQNFSARHPIGLELTLEMMCVICVVGESVTRLQELKGVMMVEDKEQTLGGCALTLYEPYI
jgi:hypothetical protein